MSRSSFYLAKRKGAFGPRYPDLWNLSKRELVEIALHLAAAGCESYDDALQSGEAGRRVVAERDALKTAGLI